jgi:hypothetical protein
MLLWNIGNLLFRNGAFAPKDLSREVPMSVKVVSFGERRVAKLRYVLLSGAKARPEFCPLHNQAYALWQSNWQKTFEDLKSNAKLSADDFVRQNIISALFDGEKAVGLLLHTYLDLNLDAVRAHSYLSTYPCQVVEGLRHSGAAQVLTMEYLTLDKNWRKSKVGVALGEVILGLGVQVLVESGFDSMVVVTRNDRQVNKILYGYGARCLAANLTKHNVSVDLVSLDKGKTYPGADSEVNRWIEYFWSRREGYADFGEFKEMASQKKSA